DVHAEIAPGKAAGVALAEQLELLRADRDLAVAGRDLLVERAEHGVVLEQVGHRLDVAEVVRRDDLEVAAALQVRPEEVTPDPPETVDSNPNRHCCLPVEFRVESIGRLRSKASALSHLQSAESSAGPLRNTLERRVRARPAMDSDPVRRQGPE